MNNITCSNDIKLILDQLDISYNILLSARSQEINKLAKSRDVGKHYQSVINDNLERSAADLTSMQCEVYNRLLGLLHGKRQVSISQSRLAIMCGIKSRRTVNEAIRVLRESGLLDVVYVHRSECVYSIPVTIQEHELLSIKAIIKPSWVRQPRLNYLNCSPIIYRNIRARDLQPLLLENDQTPCTTPEWGKEYVQDSTPITQVVVVPEEKKTLKGEPVYPEQVTTQKGELVMSDNIQDSIVQLRTWLHLSVSDEEQVRQFAPDVIEQAVLVVRPKMATLKQPTYYFLGTCRNIAEKRKQQAFFTKGTTTTSGSGSTAKKNPMYKPYEPPVQKERENPLDAAANFERNRAKMMNNLHFMGEEKAKEFIDKLIISHLTEAETGIPQDRRQFVGGLFGAELDNTHDAVVESPGNVPNREPQLGDDWALVEGESNEEFEAPW